MGSLHVPVSGLRGRPRLTGMDRRAEVRDFLMSRRARLTPADVGLGEAGARRRVPGLRREEVALLAGMSTEYYTRLERGTATGASDAVLDAIATALRLDLAEREHLHSLTRTTPVGRRSKATAVRPALQFFLDAITAAPAMVTNSRMDIVASNALGRALHVDAFADPRPNLSRFIFLAPEARSFYRHWEQAAQINVDVLRRDAGRDPYDPGITEIVGELSIQSEEFRSRWAAHNVRRHYTGTKQFTHPVVGDLELTYQTVDLNDDPGLKLLAYPAEPGTPSEERLQLLSSWIATQEQHNGDEPVTGTARAQMMPTPPQAEQPRTEQK